MTGKSFLCLALLLSGNLFADEPFKYQVPRELTNIWEYMNYPLPRSGEPWNGDPTFMVSSGGEYDQVARGLRLDIFIFLKDLPFLKPMAFRRDYFGRMEKLPSLQQWVSPF